MGPVRCQSVLLAAVLVAVLAVGVLSGLAATASEAAPAAETAPGCVAGSAGAGDPFFRLAGNGGYEVAHYGIDLTFDPAGGRLAATARISATARVALCRFDLDLRGLRVTALTVDGRPAAFRREGQELVITPADPLPAARAFTVVVAYRGVPQPVVEASGIRDGWIGTDDGALVAAEPQGAPTWFPCNDDPKDKATYDILATVPTGLAAVSNGELVGRRSTGGPTTFNWHNPTPTATYLVTLATGRFAISTGRTRGGIPISNAVDPRELESAARTLLLQGPIVDFFATQFGGYPFTSVGAIVDHAPRLGYALESQTRPVYGRAPGQVDLAHELAHQWFGDSVTLPTWPQIWLNEGFATWASWWWLEHSDIDTAQHIFAQLYENPVGAPIWDPPPGRPGRPGDLLARSVYDRGALTLEALREKIGTADFLTLLRRWALVNRHGTGTTAGFEAMAATVSGLRLQHFFDVWLRTPGKPVRW